MTSPSAGPYRVGITGRAVINRKDRGVGGDGLISEKVTPEFDIAAVRQS